MLWYSKKIPNSRKPKVDPKYPYALTKWLAEEMTVHWSNIYNFEYISLRLFNVMGLDQELQVLMDSFWCFYGSK